MNRGVQLALVIMAAIALPAPSRAGDTETIAKRAALFTPRRRAEGFRSIGHGLSVPCDQARRRDC